LEDGIPSSPRRRVGNRVWRLIDENSMPRLKITFYGAWATLFSESIPTFKYVLKYPLWPNLENSNPDLHQEKMLDPYSDPIESAEPKYWLISLIELGT